MTLGEPTRVRAEAIGWVERRRPPTTHARRVERGEVAHENGGRPPVANDVMGREDDATLLRADLHRDRPRERTALEIERPGHFARQQRIPGLAPLGLVHRREVELLERHVRTGADHEREPVAAERRAKRLVPRDEVRVRAAEGGDVERTPHPEGDRFVVGERRFVSHLGRGPDLALWVG